MKNIYLTLFSLVLAYGCSNSNLPEACNEMFAIYKTKQDSNTIVDADTAKKELEKEWDSMTEEEKKSQTKSCQFTVELHKKLDSGQLRIEE